MIKFGGGGGGKVRSIFLQEVALESSLRSQTGIVENVSICAHREDCKEYSRMLTGFYLCVMGLCIFFNFLVSVFIYYIFGVLFCNNDADDYINNKILIIIKFKN